MSYSITQLRGLVVAAVGECVQMSENPWWHPTQDGLDWDEPDAARDRWAHDAKDLAADLRAALGSRAELVVDLWPLEK